MRVDGGLEQRIHYNRLYDLYAPLLTEKQREAFELHKCEDLSLAEMSERLGVTRQAAHDLVLRARDRLGEAENTLGLMKRISLLEARIGELEERLKEATGGEKPCSMR